MNVLSRIRHNRPRQLWKNRLPRDRTSKYGKKLDTELFELCDVTCLCGETVLGPAAGYDYGNVWVLDFSVAEVCCEVFDFAEGEVWVAEGDEVDLEGCGGVVEFCPACCSHWLSSPSRYPMAGSRTRSCWCRMAYSLRSSSAAVGLGAAVQGTGSLFPTSQPKPTPKPIPKMAKVVPTMGIALLTNDRTKGLPWNSLLNTIVKCFKGWWRSAGCGRLRVLSRQKSSVGKAWRTCSNQ
ncbi:hypothetical protein CC80DRAFT_174259 [Byssothecium circinans]|uniref:Uncharacterized protein n=1 Tax=Byssothecium circinans TaxID=147558 RepID=A0A6A5THZ4_9PLEO|nr:hypothetical protein CC80DRAFT_174259 [Byssothecium circinans]